MTTIEKVRSYFMSDIKRYGLKHTKEDRVYEVIAIVFAVGGFVGLLRYCGSWGGPAFGFLALMFLSAMLSLAVSIGMLKRRVKELGGDTQQKQGK